MNNSHAADWGQEAPSPAQLKEFFAQIESGRITKVRLQKLLTGGNIIDCDVDSFMPDGSKVEKHIKGGQFEWNPKTARLYLTDEQKEGFVKGNELRKKLEGKSVLNACVLDYLLANPHLIPDEWKGRYVFFWGTIYRDSDDNLYVRYLVWYRDRWCWGYRWLDNDFNGNNPAVLSCK